MTKDPHGNEDLGEEKRVDRRAEKLSPEVLALISRWADGVGEGAPRPFRPQVSALLRALGVGSNKLYGSLARYHPDLLARLNRLRANWYEYRDAAARTAPIRGVSIARAARERGLSPSTVTRAKARQAATGRKRSGSRWELTDRVSDALDEFEADVERFEAERDLPYRPGPAVAKLAESLETSSDGARQCVRYLRPDLWARYARQLARYRAAFDAECRGPDPAELIADRYELSVLSVRKHRWRLRQREGRESE